MRWKHLSMVVVALAAAGAVTVQTGPVAAETTTYSATETIPVPPASTYQGAGGGDGWAVTLHPDDSVYNVFHHATTFRVACQRQSDASACYIPKDDHRHVWLVILDQQPSRPVARPGD